MAQDSEKGWGWHLGPGQRGYVWKDTEDRTQDRFLRWLTAGVLTPCTIFTFSSIILYSKPYCWFTASFTDSESLASWQDTGNSASRKQHGTELEHHDASSGAILNLDHMDHPFHFSFLTLQCRAAPRSTAHGLRSEHVTDGLNLIINWLDAMNRELLGFLKPERNLGLKQAAGLMQEEVIVRLRPWEKKQRRMEKENDKSLRRANTSFNLEIT